MKDTNTVIILTELVSPVDMIVRQGFKIKCREYSSRVRGNGKPWEKIIGFKQKHSDFEDFRYARYKLFMTQAILQRNPGESISIAEEFSRLEMILIAIGETIDEPVFENSCKTIYAYLTGDLELPADKSKDPLAQPS